MGCVINETELARGECKDRILGWVWGVSIVIVPPLLPSQSNIGGGLDCRNIRHNHGRHGGLTV